MPVTLRLRRRAENSSPLAGSAAVLAMTGSTVAVFTTSVGDRDTAMAAWRVERVGHQAVTAGVD